MRFIIREAGLEDLDRVVPLFEAYRAFYGAGTDPSAARAFLDARQRRGESILIVAVGGDGVLAGFAQLYPSFSSVALRRTCILNDLFVRPECRGATVARQLVAFSAARAAALGAVRLELSTQLTNTAARRLYESLGFAPDLEFTHMSLRLPA